LRKFFTKQHAQDQQANGEKKVLHLGKHLRKCTAMQQRKRFLDIVHTLSHLEHEPTEDPDLQTRREALARADKQADDGHHVTSFILDPSGVEDFALRIRG
jgi:hypothetical protein